MIFIGLNIFMPEKANDLTEIISDKTGIEKSTIEKKLDSATDIVIENSQKAVDLAKEKIEENK
ncbi:MAG: hypothetical protein KAJ49_02720 [Arcobacteraceae bacterium]|nr:hypothetical protein [Arcobacteraceae bacterium]